MFDIKADIKKNRLYFTLGDISSNEELELIISSTKNAVENLKAGFSCISDLRNYSIPEALSESFMQHCQEILWETSIGKVVRISAPDMLETPFRFEASTLLRPGYEVKIVSTLNEAEIFLNGES